MARTEYLPYNLQGLDFKTSTAYGLCGQVLFFTSSKAEARQSGCPRSPGEQTKACRGEVVAPGLLPGSWQHQDMSWSLVGAESDLLLKHGATQSATNPLDYADAPQACQGGWCRNAHTFPLKAPRVALPT